MWHSPTVHFEIVVDDDVVAVVVGFDDDTPVLLAFERCSRS